MDIYIYILSDIHDWTDLLDFQHNRQGLNYFNFVSRKIIVLKYEMIRNNGEQDDMIAM